jgi:valyl-tRNA synthetase
MQEDFSKPYVASQHEATIYETWETSGAFRPSSDVSKPAFSLVMPPLNSNGNMHMGHALTMALEDAMTRWHRMKGDRTLWTPGTDHAGIETQVVFEKKLEKEGRSRFQMERKQFYEEVLAFTLENKGNIESQARLLGASCDWSANRFTLDSPVIDGVYATFRKMFGEGLIYRGERIVNYSTKYRTAYSDLEVEYEERTDPLYYLKYGPITVATVRPETKFGEKVIVVHPEDERYAQYVGKSIRAKIVTGEELEMRVIADEVIKPEFGTGAMTITPAHDPIDFELARRHGLEVVPIIGLDGRMLPIAGEFAGMKVAEARKAVAARMQELGLIERIDQNYSHAVALDYKSLQPIEPLVMPQWYVRVGPLRDRAIKAIEAGEIRFHPENYKKIILDWLASLRDWNISRQIWWGIPINGAGLAETANDPDTFDTWFSSAQWPYLALGDQTAAFYPNSVMETGRDLIFLWVTRMILMGLYVKGEVPFRDVYLHGMVLDRQGKKMSKSKGNVISPVELVAKYGADAVRFGLLVGSAAGSDIPLPEEKIIGGRNFCNKLWNIARFVVTAIGDELPGEVVAITEADVAILQALQDVRAEVNSHMINYRFAQALQALHEFVWHRFADVYLEQAKAQPGARTNAVLWQVLTVSLKLLHPFIPFVTEAIWSRLPGEHGILITAAWPE